jgi:hypothetical protein
MFTIWSNATSEKLSTDTSPKESCFRDRSVNHPLRTVLLEETIGDGIRTAVLTDVLTHDEDIRVVVERFRQTTLDCFSKKDFCHLFCRYEMPFMALNPQGERFD